MKPFFKSVLAVLAGMLTAAVLIAAWEPVSHMIFPPPQGIDPSDPESLKTLMDKIPLGAFISVLAGWSFATCVGAWLAARLARRAPMAHGMVIGVVVLATGLVPMLFIPHPLWFQVAAVGSLPSAAYVGAWLAKSGKSPQQPALESRL